MSEDTQPQYEVNQVVKFKGYAQALPEGMPPIFTEGQSVKLIAPGDDEGSFKAALIDDPTKQDTVFGDEIEPLSETAPAEAEAPVKAKKAKKAAAKSVQPTAVAEDHAAPAKTKTKAAAPKAKAPKSKVKEKVEEKAVVVVPDSASVRSLLDSQDALDAAKALHTQIEESYFTFGGVLSYIRKNKSYQTIKNGDGEMLYGGNEGFARYVEAELETKYRKVMYLIEIYEHFTKLGIDEKRLTQIGWSKASQLARVADSDNFEELLEYAKTHTKQEVEDHIKETIVKAGGSVSAKKIAFTFRLFQDKARVAKQALVLAGKKIDSEDVSEQFDFILTEWLSIQEGADIPIEDAIAHLEQKYDTKLSVEVPAEAETAAV